MREILCWKPRGDSGKLGLECLAMNERGHEGAEGLGGVWRMYVHCLGCVIMQTCH